MSRLPRGARSGHSGLSVQRVTSWLELAPVQGQWRALLADSQCNQPTLSPLWLRSWWEVFGEGTERSLEVFLVWAGGELVGLAPLQRRLHRHRGLLPLRRIEFVASGEASEDEILSEYLAVVARNGWEETVTSSIVERLVEGEGGSFDELVFVQLDGSAPTTLALGRALGRAGLDRSEVRTASAPYIPLPASWDDYLAALPGRHRYVVRRAERDLSQWAGGKIEVHVVERADQLAQAWDVLKDLHAERWQLAGQSGVFASEKFCAFHRRVLPALLEEGALDLCWLEAAGRPVAASYSTVWGGKISYYQGGRAADLPGKLRPGIALHAHRIRAAIAAGHSEYDFLAGSQQYKKQMALAERPLIAIRATHPRSARELARRAVDAGIEAARVLRGKLAARRRGVGSAETER